MKRKRYSEEFKRQVLDYAAASHKPVTEICEDFKISPGLYYAWKKKLLSDGANCAAGSGGGQEPSPADLHDEVRRLRKELAKSKRREEILKKAALILGINPHDDMS